MRRYPAAGDLDPGGALCVVQISVGEDSGSVQQCERGGDGGEGGGLR